MPQRNLSQAKFLFEKAQLLWEPYRDITNGIVVSLLQDAAELALWAIVKAHAVDVKPRDGFVSILEKLSVPQKSLRGKAQVLEINNARVNFKHYGLSPSSADIPRFVEGARFFLAENIREFLGLEFENVSLADEVAIAELRSLLREAERQRDTNNLDEAMVQVSLAYQEMLQLVQRRHFGDFPSTDGLERMLQGNVQDEARMFFFEMRKFFERFTAQHALFTLGVSQDLFEELERRRVVVTVSMSGKRLGVHPRREAHCTLDNVNFLISHVTDMARRVPPGR